MRRSDYDLDVLADQIKSRLVTSQGTPTIREIVQHIDELGFMSEEAEILTRLTMAKIQQPGLKPRHIVILIHGIRTNAEWHGIAVKALSPHCAAVYPVKYGFFDLISFWFPLTFIFRRMPIRQVHDELKSVIANNPSAYVSVVAHSFGTYIISKVLKENFEIRLFRLLMCGAIVPLKYDWRRLSNKPRAGLMNDVGLKDRLPIIAESLTWGYGASGTYGFGTAEIDDNFHDCGHSGFFTEAHLNKYWVPFLFHGEYVISSKNSDRKPPAYPWELFRLIQAKYLLVMLAGWYLSRTSFAKKFINYLPNIFS